MTNSTEAVPVELSGVAEVLSNGDGFWRSCSGCHETEDGHPVGHYPFSAILKCDLGGGCSECGGIGAVWDDTDYGAMAEAFEREEYAKELASEQTAAASEVAQAAQAGSPAEGEWCETEDLADGRTLRHEDDEQAAPVAPTPETAAKLSAHDALRYMACRDSAIERGLFATPEEYDAMVDDSLRKKGKEVLTGRGNNYGKKVAKDGSLYRVAPTSETVAWRVVNDSLCGRGLALHRPFVLKHGDMEIYAPDGRIKRWKSEVEAQRVCNRLNSALAATAQSDAEGKS